MSADVATTATERCPAWRSTHVPPADATDTAMHLASEGETLWTRAGGSG